MIELQRRRFDAGLTPEQLGELVGVSGRQIRRIEESDGAVRIRPQTAKKLADHFKVTPSDLLRLVDPTAEAAA